MSTLLARHAPFGIPLDLRRALTSPPPLLDHVLPGLLAGTVGVLAGPGGVGKTMLELQLAMAIATGTPACNGLFDEQSVMDQRRMGKVVFVAAEESVEVLWHRLHAISARLLSSAAESGLALAPSVFLERLEQNLEVYPLGGAKPVTLLDSHGHFTKLVRPLFRLCRGARLVLLDPLRQFHDGDENSSANMNQVVRLTRTLAQRTGAAIIVAHHTNRASGQLGLGDTAGAARGSTALTDGARWQMNLSKPGKDWAKSRGIGEGDRDRFLLVDIAKANYLPPQKTVVLERHIGGALQVIREGILPAGNSKPTPARRTTSKLAVVAK